MGRPHALAGSVASRTAAWMRFVQVAIALGGLGYGGAGMALLFAPRWFFEHIGFYPPFNRHYSGDLGAFVLVLGLGLLMSARNPARHRRVIGIAAAGSSLHTLNHAYDALMQQAPLDHWRSDVLPVLLLSALPLLGYAGLITARDQDHQGSEVFDEAHTPESRRGTHVSAEITHVSGTRSRSAFPSGPVASMPAILKLPREDGLASSATYHIRNTRIQAVPVRAVMTSPAISIAPTTRLPDIKRLMQEQHIRRVPVMNKGQLVGIVTLGDIRHALPSAATTLSIYELNYLLDKVTAAEIMTRAVITIEADAPLVAAAKLMLHHKVSGLPVLTDYRMVGIITEIDIFRAIVAGQLPLPTWMAVST